MIVSLTDFSSLITIRGKYVFVVAKTWNYPLTLITLLVEPDSSIRIGKKATWFTDHLMAVDYRGLPRPWLAPNTLGLTCGMCWAW
jgi:hypothetical protein